MPQKAYVFTLKTIDKIDALNQSFDELLKTCVRDCIERPGLNKIRKLTLHVDVKPDTEDADKVHVDITCSSSIPARAIPDYRMITTTTGGLKFQPNAPNEPDAQLLFEDDEDNGENEISEDTDDDK